MYRVTRQLGQSFFISVVTASLLLIPLGAQADKEGKDKHHALPPGLVKNYNRGKPLPPGWQKKLRKGDYLSDDIYLHGQVVVPLGKDGRISISVDGTLIQLIESTKQIIDFK